MNTEELNNTLNIQKNNLKILLDCLNNINSVIQNTDSFEDPSELVELLKDTKTNLDNTRNNISNLETLKKHSSDLSDSSSINDYNELSSTYKEIISKTDVMFQDYLSKYVKCTSFSVGNTTTTTSNSTTTNENVNTSTSNNVTSVTSNSSTENSWANTPNNIFSPVIGENVDITNNSSVDTTSSANTNNNFNTTSTNNIFKSVDWSPEEEASSVDNVNNTTATSAIDNNVLLISEKRNRIVLPYTVEELDSILSTNKTYKSYQEIIDDRYTLPLNKYKSSPITRFKETYNLMRKKEKASIIDSLDLALELAFYGKLNPAIIVACNSLEQLDTYLDCLELNELSKFTDFEVKYEFLPTKRY